MLRSDAGEGFRVLLEEVDGVADCARGGVVAGEDEDADLSGCVFLEVGIETFCFDCGGRGLAAVALECQIYHCALAGLLFF